MDKIVIVDPGITPEDMHHLWNEAIEVAETHPGETVVILFEPGDYPLPHPGAYVYREEPTLMHVSEPGIEMRFRASPVTGTVEIKTAHPEAA